MCVRVTVLPTSDLKFQKCALRLFLNVAESSEHEVRVDM
jgi:hypothetical protein